MKRQQQNTYIFNNVINVPIIIYFKKELKNIIKNNLFHNCLTIFEPFKNVKLMFFLFAVVIIIKICIN